MVTKHMVHLNGHLLCSIDVETTGLEADKHELLQVCFLPLDNLLEPSKHYTPFDVYIRPERPEDIDAAATSVNQIELATIMATGFDKWQAADLFDDWFENLNLGGKRITPLAHNWPFDRGFLIEWMGWENFNYRIDGRFRDTMAEANAMNDRSDFNGQQTPFPSGTNLTRVAKRLGIEVDEGRTHDALYDCLLCSKIYKKMITEFFE